MNRRFVAAGTLLLAAASSACMPRLSPLVGEPQPAARLPHIGVAPGHSHIVFNWELEDRDMAGRGEGVARVAAPDSARLDFFLAGGFGHGAAVLIGDSLRTPGGDNVARRLVPPPALLWAALGRVALPNLPDTVIRVEGTTLRADIGRPVMFRLTFHGDSLVRAERVNGGRVAEWVERSGSRMKYRNEGSRRSLQLVVTRTEHPQEFDASIWVFDR
jgi:hypothetical protein